jgi:hypothetical protein
MLHKEFWGLVFLAFVVWIFLAVDGSARIERGCRPIAWGGNLAVSLTALVVPKQQEGVKRWMDKAEYSCRYATWRLFYQADYNRAVRAASAGRAAASRQLPGAGPSQAHPAGAGP